MKKSSNVLSWILTLTLILSVLVLGVYAASSTSAGTTSTVNFSVEDVFVSITGTLYKDADGNTTGATSLATFNGGSAWRSHNNGTPKNPTNPGSTTPLTPSWAIGSVSVDAAQSYAVYVVTITNDAGVPIKVTGSESTDTFNSANNMTRVSHSYIVTGDAAATTLEANNSSASKAVAVGSSITFTYVAKVADLTKTVSSFDVELSYAIVKA